MNITNQSSSVNDNNLNFTLNNLSYSIRPVNLSAPSHLRCIISITNKNNYQTLDRLDLYNAGSRRLFIKKSVSRLETDAVLLEKHLLEIVNKLESIRMTHDSPLMTVLEIPPESKKEALAYLKSPDLLNLIIADYKSCGYVGEEKNFLTGYLVATSRKLSKPLGMIIISRSGAGKSTLQQAIVSFIPPEDCLNYTRITNQAFFYKGRFALKHKLISIDEEKGIQGASYAVRSLLNGEGLTSTSTIKDPVTGIMKASDQIVEGPSGMLIGTTGAELDHETLSRLIVITIDESMEQTRRILEKQREQDTLEGIKRTRARDYILNRHHNIQRLIQPLTVINNTGKKTINLPVDRLITRRGQIQYNKLIKSVALLRQYQKETKTASDGISEFQYIEVDEIDVRLADEIAEEVLKRGADELTPVTRNFLCELKKLKQSKSGNNGHSNKFTRREIRDFTKWNDYQIRQCLHELENMEYIIRASGSQGKLCEYELIYDGSNQLLEENYRLCEKNITLRQLCEPISQSVTNYCIRE